MISNIVFKVPRTRHTEKIGIAGRKGRVIDVWRNGKFLVHTDIGDFPIYEIPHNVKTVIHYALSEREQCKET